MNALTILSRVFVSRELEDAYDRIAVLESELSDARVGLLVARAIAEVHHDCVPRKDMVQLAHRVEIAELEREQARDHAVHLASACTCAGIEHGETT